MQDSKLMQQKNHTPLTDVQSQSISTNEQSTNLKANKAQINGQIARHLDSEKENICPMPNSSMSKTCVPQSITEAIRSQKCVQTQIKMASRCLKQSAEEAIQAFEEMFQNDILAIDSEDQAKKGNSSELDKTLSFVGLYFEIVEESKTQLSKEVTENQVQALTKVIEAFGLFEFEGTQST